jgi:hypothetical protein
MLTGSLDVLDQRESPMLSMTFGMERRTRYPLHRKVREDRYQSIDEIFTDIKSFKSKSPVIRPDLYVPITSKYISIIFSQSVAPGGLRLGA